MTFVDLFQNLVTNWTRERQTVCSTGLTPPSTTKIALITFLGAILLLTPSWVVFANASRRTNGVRVCIPSLIFTPYSADHIDYVTRSYRWWKGCMFPQCRFVNRRMPTRVSRRVRIHHSWWPFSLPKFRLVAVENNCIPEYVDKFTSECGEGEVLNATDEGCVCQPISTATATGSTCCMWHRAYFRAIQCLNGIICCRATDDRWNRSWEVHDEIRWYWGEV